MGSYGSGRENTSLSVRISAVIFVVFVCYALLVVGDYALARWISYIQENQISEAAKIELRRQNEEDQPQRDQAIKDGFRPVISPYIIENYRSLQALTIKHGVAPLGAHPNTQLYYCNEGYGLVTYVSDRFGFRNNDLVWENPEVDITVIGDSFTQGACVFDQDTISAQLSRVSGAKVINLSAGGNNPIHYASLSKVFLKKIRSKFAVIVFYANDNSAGNKNSAYYEHYFNKKYNYFSENPDGSFGVSEKLKSFYRDSSPVIRDILQNDDRANEEKLDFLERGSLFKRIVKYLYLPNIRHVLEVNGVLTSDYQRAIPFSSKLAIDTLKKACQSAGCLPIVTYIPNSPYWRPDPRSERYAELLSIYSEETGIPFVDNTESIRLMGRQAYATKGAHLSPEGYSVVARNINYEVRRLK